MFPTDIGRSVSGKKGHGFLNRCLACGGRLAEIEPCNLDVDGFRRVTRFEDIVLRNGRALLATLYYGRFRMDGKPGWLHPRKFREVARLGLLPVRFDWLEPAVVRQRSIDGLSPGCPRWSDGTAPNQELIGVRVPT